MIRIKQIVFLSILILIISSAIAYPNDIQPQKTRIVEGKVVALDWVASLLVVRRYQGISSDDLNLVVSDSTSIVKGGREIGLFDINIEDWVIVEYYDAGIGGLKAKTISVKS